MSAGRAGFAEAARAPLDRAAVHAVFERARCRDQGVLLEPEAMAVLEAAGIDVPRRLTFEAAAEVAALPDPPLPEAGDRVVLKAVGPRLLHKTEASAVRVLPNRREAVAAEARAMEARLAGSLTGFMLAGFVAHQPVLGHELLLGMRWTRAFGPVVSLGAGGIHAEFLASALRDDGAMAVFSPLLSSEEAVRAGLSRVTAVRLATEPQRGRPPGIGIEALAEAVRRFLALAESHCPDPIAEFEVNPLVVTDGRLVALDALLTLSSRRPCARAPRPIAKIGRLLEPRSIAVVGVSERMNPGRIILQNILREGFDPARVTVVKPGLETIDGCRCVAGLDDLQAPVDVVVLSVSAEQTAEMVSAIAESRGAESVIVIAGGLEERPGAEGLVARMREALAGARATPWGGPVVNGGNCLGIRSQPGRYNTLFIPEHKLPASHGAASPVALVTGSGAFAVSKTSKLAGINPLYTITIGNQMDLTAADYLDYLKDDGRVEVFAFYLEGFADGDGARFLRTAAGIAASGRAVIAYLAGRTGAGATAAASHTAAVATDHAVVRRLAVASGVVLADTLADFEDLVRLFVFLGDRPPSGFGLGAVSNAGYESVAIADRLGPFALSEWSAGTVAELEGVLRRARLDGIVTVRNPIDLTPIMGDGDYEAIVRGVLADPAVDAGIVGCVPLTGALDTLAAGPGHGEDIGKPGGIVRRLIDVRRTVARPWVAVVDAGRLYDPMAHALEDGGVPVFRTADRAMRLFGAWCANRLAVRATGA